MTETGAPLAGRRMYFVGIGGAGLSAYANIVRAWGGEVRGWDLRETIFMETLRGVEIDVGGDPEPPTGWEVVLSSAHLGRAQGRPRAELLAELVALRRSIVVGGAHGKTTTAAMIAYALRELGRDPSWIVGGVVPQLGGNAGAGAGEWLVVEGDESDRSIALLEPDVGVVTNVELDHHAAFSSGAELAAFFESWLEGATSVVRGWELAPVEIDLSVPGEHNRMNAAAALSALEHAGVDRPDAERALAGFTGVARRFELVGERGDVRVYDDYAHNPTEIVAALETARSFAERSVVAVYQPHVHERTRHLALELGEALGLADTAIVTEVIGGRDAPRPGIGGKLVLDSVPAGTRRGWAPTLDDAAALALAFARPGDVVVTLGVGEPWKVARAVVEGLP
ncbi:MAG TPA: cyanophycin synthetase [Gaiellaceae bacterium]|nr:cyanophycin synthetase [Gaiellaceae bacterium]